MLINKNPLKCARQLLCLLSVLFSLSACTHLHDPGNAQLAGQIKDEFSKITANDSNIYTAMLENKALMESNEQQTIEALRISKGKALSNMIPALTWIEINNDLSSKEQALNELQKQINIEDEKLNNRLKEIAEKLPISKNNLEAAKALLTTAAKKQNQWVARQELFRQSIKQFADIYTKSETEEDFDTADALKKAKDEILKTEISVIEIDPNGKDTEGKSTIKKELNIDHDINIDRLNQLIKSYSGDLFDPEAAPGLKIVILGLAVDLADKELKRNKLDVAYLQQIIEYLQTFEAHNTEIKEKMRFVKVSKINIKNRAANKMTENVLDTINLMRKNKAEREALIDLFQALTFYSYVMLDEELDVINLKKAMIDHQYSIELSAINAQEHEALINRGLQGLAIYHEGGITPETIANFLRAAQSVALGVIGAGVL